MKLKKHEKLCCHLLDTATRLQKVKKIVNKHNAEHPEEESRVDVDEFKEMLIEIGIHIYNLKPGNDYEDC